MPGIAEEIKSRADIADVIGRTVKLKRSGSRWTGLCPFHNEKTPSFFVNDDTQTYMCFGCGAHGDVIAFYERYYNLSFLEAAERLAGEYGIEWKTGGDYVAETQKSRLYELNRLAAQYYHKAIREPGNPAFAYMLDRGVTPDTMVKFGVGYADGSRNGLEKYLRSKDASLEDAAAIGLLAKERSGYRDKFFNRVMFPIINTRGKVVGFGGRVLGQGEPKYMNSSESKIFLKKNNLYAINHTKDLMVKTGTAILVEGYMDVIALCQQGIGNVTASLGTALTAAQARMLKRYAANAVIAYDADAAGQAAALRAIDILAEAGLHVKVLVVEGAKDPDEYIRKNGAEAFHSLVEKAVPATAFRLGRIKEGYNLEEQDGAVAFLQEATKALGALRPVEADFYIKKLADETGITEGAIRREAYGDRMPEQKRRTAGRDEGKGFGPPGAPIASGDVGNARGEGRIGDAEREKFLAIQRNLLRLLVYDASFADRISGKERVFTELPLFRIYSAITGLIREREGGDVDIKDLEDGLGEAERTALAEILETVVLGENPEQLLEDCLKQIELKELFAAEKEIIDVLSLKGDADVDTDTAMLELMKIQKEIRRIKEGGTDGI
jgi:DNA primase